MKGLIKLARSDPEMLWTAFQCWYDRQSLDKMPCWIIERFDAGERPPAAAGGLLADEVHIHIWDYAIEAIEDYLREFCAQNKLELSVEAVRDRWSGKRLCISQDGRPLLRMHDTACSTNSDPFICVHLKPDDAAIRTLLAMFENAICPKSLTFYEMLYRQARPGLENLQFYRWHIDRSGTDMTATTPRST